MDSERLPWTYFFTFAPDTRALDLNGGMLAICGGIFGCHNDYGLHRSPLPQAHMETQGSGTLEILKREEQSY